MKKAFNIVTMSLIIPMLVSAVVAESASGKFAHDPLVPDLFTGHTIPLSMKGTGTVYLTEAEWQSIAPYWNITYVISGLLAAFLAARLIFEGYQSFMQEWRRPDGKNDKR